MPVVRRDDCLYSDRVIRNNDTFNNEAQQLLAVFKCQSVNPIGHLIAKSIKVLECLLSRLFLHSANT